MKQDRLGMRFNGRCATLALKNWGLAIALVVGFLLRFWNLDLKPLWLDETISLLFSLGHRYEDIPRETLLPLGDLLAGLVWQPQSCHAIAQSINTQSTHPPLFFCWMHQWMGLLRDTSLSLRWQVRSLPALFGVAEIAAIYGLNRVAFSHRAGLWAAGLMAVSPFAVYLSQEARHYTLPMLAITLSLIPAVQIAQRIASKQSLSAFLWLAWAALNSLGFYIHYFCLLAFIAQVAMLLGLILHQRQWRRLAGAGAAIGLVGLSLLPWLPFMVGHSQRSETDWLRFEGGGILDWLGPLARLLAGGIITMVMLPVENQPLAIAVGNGLIMLAIAVYLSRILWQQIPRLLHKQTTRSGAVVLSAVLLGILAEYLLLVYVFHKDLTLAPRYAFVFYPMLCALVAVSLSNLSHKAFQSNPRLLPWSLILVGLLSTSCVVNDLAFLKPFQPKQIAQQFLMTSDPVLIVLQEFQGTQDVALGLSSALAVQQFSQQSGAPRMIEWAFADAQNLQCSKSGNPKGLVFDPSTPITNEVLTLKVPLFKGDLGGSKPNGITDNCLYTLNAPAENALEGNDLAERSPFSSPVTLWRIGALQQKIDEAASLEISILKSRQKEGLICLAQQHSHLEVGVQYQPFRCKIAALKR